MPLEVDVSNYYLVRITGDRDELMDLAFKYFNKGCETLSLNLHHDKGPESYLMLPKKWYTENAKIGQRTLYDSK